MLVSCCAALPNNQAEASQPATFYFVVSINGNLRPYNEHLDADVAIELPSDTWWTCIRRKVFTAPDGEQNGVIQCSADGDTTMVFVTARCGGRGFSEQHNTVDLMSRRGGGSMSFVSLHANCEMEKPKESTWYGF